MGDDAPRLSIVVPAYNEAENLRPLHAALHAVLEPLGQTYEIIFVDDGSADETPERLRQLALEDARLVVVTLRRNFGQTAALAAGIDQARGELLVTLDADMQNDPSDIPRLLTSIDEGYDLVTGWRRHRRDPYLTRVLPSAVANRIVSRITGVKIHDFGCTLRIYRTELLRDVKLYGEMHRLLPALLEPLGASIHEMEVMHRPRLHGKSKYGLTRTLKVLLDLMTIKFMGTYSTKPIYLFGTIGLFCLLSCFGVGLFVIYNKVVNHVYMIQSPLLHLTVFLGILGVQFLMLGLIAEVLMRTYYESQRKPTYHVRRVLRGGHAQTAKTHA